MSYESKIFNSLLNHSATIKRPIFRPQVGTPYAYYPFDVDAKDYSGNSRDLTLGFDSESTNEFPALIAAGGQSGNSLLIADANAVAYRASTGVASTSDPFSISFWVNPSNFTTTMIAYSERDVTSAGAVWYGLDINIYTDGTIGVSARRISDSATVIDGVSATALSANVWSHFAITFDGVETAKLYLNGAQTGSDITCLVDEPLTSGATTLGIGGDPSTNSSKAHLVGRIDEVTLFSSALSAGNISSIYSGTPTRDNYGRPQAQAYNYQRGVTCHFSDHRLPGAITSGKEGLIFQVEYTKQQPICVLPYAYRPHVLDTIVHEETGIEYEVESVEDAAGQGQHWRAFLKRFE